MAKMTSLLGLCLTLSLKGVVSLVVLMTSFEGVGRGGKSSGMMGGGVGEGVLREDLGV